MPCDRMSLLKRLAVESPAQLQTPPWQEHMEGCGECRMEIQLLDTTLAVFKQIESEGRAQKEFGPSWEAFTHAVDQAETMEPIPSHLASGDSSAQVSQALAQAQAPIADQTQKSRPNRRWGMMASLASAISAATVAATVAGVMLWPVDPLSEAPRKEAASAAGTERAAGNAKSFRIGGGFPAPSALPQSVWRPLLTPTPVIRQLGGPAPSFVRNRWRSGAGSHPAPVILFRSLQNRKSMGMDRPALYGPAVRVSTRTVARPAKRRGKVGPTTRAVASKRPKTAPARSNRRPAASRSRAKASSRLAGGGAMKPRVAVKPISPIPGAPFTPGVSGGPPPPRPKAEAFTGLGPAVETSLEKMLAPPGEKLKLQAMMDAEEMAKTDAEPKLNESDPFPDDPESQNDAKLEDGLQPAGVAP